MSESGEAETRSQPRERGEAQDRRSRPRARVMADTRRQQQTFVVNVAIGDSRLRRGRHRKRSLFASVQGGRGVNRH
jgi:hypothetical protein